MTGRFAGKPAQAFPVDERLVPPITELAAMIRDRQATSTDIVQAHINLIKNENYRTNAFVWLFDDDALAAARRADDAVARGGPLGRLHGVPVSIKEELWVTGKPNPINSDMFRGFVAAARRVAHGSRGAIVRDQRVPNLLIDWQPPADTRWRQPARHADLAEARAAARGRLALALGGGWVAASVPGGLRALRPQDHRRQHGHFGSFPERSRNITDGAAGPLAHGRRRGLAWRAPMARRDGQDAGGKPALDRVALSTSGRSATRPDGRRQGGTRLATLVEALARKASSRRTPSPGFALVPMHSLLAAYLAFEKVPWILRQLLLREYRAGDTHRFDFSEAADRMSDMDPGKYDDILARRDALSAGIDAFFRNYDVLILPVTPGPAILHNPEHTPIAVDGGTIDYADYFKYPLVFNVTGHPALTVPGSTARACPWPSGGGNARNRRSSRSQD
jgi:aspartyl-tRNA(Asn)/glutamyl-tRNA(Gln) amidotransferase subunit A